jgi:hypothetical protein
MQRLLVLMVSFGCGCHLVFPHAPVPGRDAASERPTLDVARDLALGAEGGPADLRPERANDQHKPDQRKPDLTSVQGKTCQNAAKTVVFTADVPPAPGATLALTVCAKNPASTTWIMAGVKVKLADGKGSCCAGCYVGKVQTFSCSGYSNGWKIDGIKVPAGAGPFAFSLLADCVGDSRTHSTCKELAWCTP